MNRFLDWVTNVLAPKMNKFAANPWVASMQQSVYSIMPLILFGSFVTISGSLRLWLTWIPDLSLISSFSFGLMGLFITFLFPYNLLEKKGYSDSRIIASTVSLGLFLMIILPTFDGNGNITFEFARFGAGGMFSALVAAIFTSHVWLFTRKAIQIKSTSLPSFIIEWVNALVPLAIVTITGYVLTFVFEIEVYNVIAIIMKPVFTITQTLPGFMLISFVQSFFYSMGVSTHVINPFLFPLMLMATQQNIDAVAVGEAATNIMTFESVIAFNDFGGTGNHLSLVLMMIFMAKSKRLKAIGKAAFPPVMFNINEPVIFGAPVVFNPLLMVPMWIQGLLFPALIYFAMHLGFIAFPTTINTLYQIPPFMVAFMVFGIRGLIFAAFLFALSGLIYFPFLKAYDKQIELEEQVENAQ